MTITIITDIPGRYGFNVSVGDRSTGELGWDEMLGLIASLTIPTGKPCLQWLKTDEQNRKEWDRCHTIPDIEEPQTEGSNLNG